MNKAMLNDEMRLDVEVDEFFDGEAEPPAGAPPDELDAWVDKRLGVLRALDRAMARNLRYYERRKEELDAWLERENGKLQRVYDFLVSQLKSVARSYPYPGKAKSRSLANGTIGIRRIAEKLTIQDRDAAVAWAKTIPELADEVQTIVTEKISYDVLRDYWSSTGIVPAGCQVTPEHVDPYVKIEADTEEARQ